MEDPELLSYILFIVFSLVSGSLIQWFISKVRWSVPVSIIWLLYGAMLCVIELMFVPMRSANSTDRVVNISPDDGGGLMALGIAEASRLPHNALYFIVLPILLYDATQQVDWYYFRKNLRNGCALAVTGIVLQVFVIGALMKLASGDIRLSFAAWVMISSGVGATDPIAVLSVLEHMDAPKQLSSLIDCESLINDGSAVFLFQFFRALASGEGLGVKESTCEFLRLLLLAPVVGLLSALVLYRCVRHFRFHMYNVTLLIVGVAYLVYLISEIYVHTSGPIAIVVYGVYFRAYGRAGLDHNADVTHRIFVKGLGVGATSLVFIITGLTCVRIFWDTFNGKNNLMLKGHLTQASLDDETNLANFSSTLLWHMPVFYLFCHVARGAMVIVFTPLIRKDLGSFSWKEAVLLWWGGLRGGVCLIIALLIEQDHTLPRQLRSLAALYLASTTVLILLINGTTFEYLFSLLQPYEQNPFKALYLLKVLKFIDTEFEEEARLLQDHWLFVNTDVLTLSKNLVPRLANINVSSAQGIHFPAVSIRKTMKKILMSQYSFGERGKQRQDESPDTEMIIISSSPTSVYGEGPRDSKSDHDVGLSSSMVSLSAPTNGAFNESRKCDVAEAAARLCEEEPMSIAQRSSADLQEPLLGGSPTYTSNSIHQPLYRVAAYSGGYTYRNRMERIAQKPMDDNLTQWLDSPGGSLGVREANSTETSPESSWSTHFLGFTHCGHVAGVYAPDQTVLSPNAALKIKSVLTWEREGEVSVMVTNSARHLYRRMYEQCFISGNNYMNFMAVGDLVNDFCVSRGKPGKQKHWHKLIQKRCILETRLQSPEELDQQLDILKITPFDLEWMLMCRKLHMCSNWELPVYKSIQKKRMWFGWLRRLVLHWWRIMGSRQTFPALDDLQQICAFADVHEEMLLRGNQGLKFVLGQHLLESYIKRAAVTQTSMVKILQEVYPESFKYALVCHGAIFLINLKIQLVEEYNERGLLMSSDCDVILTTLKRQLVKVMRYHPSI